MIITGVNLKVKGLAGKRKTHGENNDSDRDGENALRPIWRCRKIAAVKRRWLLNSPASPDEFFKLELPRA
jgi:hypothetical protein